MKTNKIVILDTNILIYDPYSLFSFDESHLILPMVVLEELDEIKAEHSEFGHNARMAIRFLEQISKLGHMIQGVEIDNHNCPFLLDFKKKFKSFVQVVFWHKQEKMIPELIENSNDNKILSICLEAKNNGKEVSLVTRDINLRIKARALEIDAITFDHHPLNYLEMRGYREISVEDTAALKNLSAKNITEVLDLSDFPNNEYLIVKSQDNPAKQKIFQFNENTGFKDIYKIDAPWGFKAQNLQQEIAFNLLLDDSIPLVFLIGGAGTGKTMLTLLAGLHKVLTDRAYEKLFVARPLVSLGSDIGFVPGDLQEKLFHWMHPFYDNLEYIFKELDLRGEMFSIPKRTLNQFEEYLKVNRGGKNNGNKKFFADEFGRNQDKDVHSTVANLQRKGFMSLEAITHMRGRSLPNQFMFIDEVQNLTPQEVKTIITRAGKGTKIVLAGDPYQIDSHNMDFYSNGLMSSLLKLRNQNLVGYVFLDVSERSPLASLAGRRL